MINEFFACLYDLIRSETFWTFAVALGTGFVALGIRDTRKQLRYEAWNKAQDLFTNPQFTSERAIIFKHFHNPKSPWRGRDKRIAETVCRKMDTFCHLAPFVREKKMLEVWGPQIAKAWSALEWRVLKERGDYNEPTKWDAFAALGNKAIDALPKKERINCRNTRSIISKTP